MIQKLTTLFSNSAVVLTGLLFISTSAIASSSCDNLKGCEKKFCQIEKQIKIAQEKGNKHKEDGLKTALKSSKKHCSEEGLKKELSTKINEIKEEITEYESDLKEAVAYDKKDKINKYQEKIKEEKNKIKILKEELSALN